MGIPREAIHLVEADDGVRLVGTRTGTDHTRAMQDFSERRVAQLERLDLSGYILKKDSPSCGLHRVRVTRGTGGVTRNGRGLFADALQRRLPNLPIEEEGRLHDPRLRDNWIERVFAYRRVRSLWANGWRQADLVVFHTNEKLTILAHSPSAYARLGRLVAAGKSMH